MELPTEPAFLRLSKEEEMKHYLLIDTDERREAYLLMFGAVKAMSEKEARNGKAGKADQTQQQAVF